MNMFIFLDTVFLPFLYQSVLNARLHNKCINARRMHYSVKQLNDVFCFGNYTFLSFKFVLFIFCLCHPSV